MVVRLGARLSRARSSKGALSGGGPLAENSDDDPFSVALFWSPQGGEVKRLRLRPKGRWAMVEEAAVVARLGAVSPIITEEGRSSNCGCDPRGGEQRWWRD